MNYVIDRLEAIENLDKVVYKNKVIYENIDHIDYIDKIVFNLSKKFVLNIFKLLKTVNVDYSSRPKMQCVYFNCNNNLLEIVSCDGKIMAKLDKLFQYNVKDFSFLIHYYNLYDILSNIKNCNENLVSFILDDNYLTVKTFNFQITKPLLYNKNYINYNRILPKPEDINFSLIINKNHLLKTIDKLNSVYLHLKYRDLNNCMIEDSMILDIIPKIYGDIPKHFEIILNSNNIKIILKLFNSKILSFNFVNDNYPVLIKDFDNDNFKCLIIPYKNVGNNTHNI